MNLVEFYKRNDGNILAYLEDTDESWAWDGHYYTMAEFLEKYKEYVRIDVTEIIDSNTSDDIWDQDSNKQDLETK